MSRLDVQAEFFKKRIDIFKEELNNSKLNEEYQLIAMATMVGRGWMKDTDGFITWVEAIEERDNVLIKQDLLGDKKAVEKDADGNVTYTQIGKTAGLKTYATLSKDATDEQIQKFYDWLKLLKKKMPQVKEKMTLRYSIDWLKAI